MNAIFGFNFLDLQSHPGDLKAREMKSTCGGGVEVGEGGLLASKNGNRKLSRGNRRKFQMTNHFEMEKATDVVTPVASWSIFLGAFAYRHRPRSVQKGSACRDP